MKKKTKKFLLSIVITAIVITVAFAFSGCNAEESETVITEEDVAYHNLKEEPSETAEPTCTEKGFKIYDCNGKYSRDYGNPLGHQFSSYNVTKEATCSETGTETSECVRCGEQQDRPIPKTEHNYQVTSTQNATCSADGRTEYTCTVCNDIKTEIIPKVNHSYTKTVKSKATCTANGTAELKCSVCGATSSETIKATGHNYTKVSGSGATCTAAGNSVMKCSNCGDQKTETQKALGHKWTAATCTAAKKCSRCGITEENALGHTTTSGKCGRCNQTITDTRKQLVIEAENKHHEDMLTTINLRTDTKFLDSKIERIKKDNGVYIINSVSYYSQQESRLIQQRSNLESRIAYLRLDTSGANQVEILNLQKESISISEEINKIIELKVAAELIEEKEMLLKERESSILNENSRHKSALESIEKGNY